MYKNDEIASAYKTGLTMTSIMDSALSQERQMCD